MYQLRAFANAGFRAIVAVTGHHANQPDLRIVAEEFCRERPMRIVVVSDPELVAGEFAGDHAGRHEISQLLHVRPDLVKMDRLGDVNTSPLGRFAQGDDAAQASAKLGEAIIERSLDRLRTIVEDCRPLPWPEVPFMSFDDAERVWQRVVDRVDEWCTLREEPPLDVVTGR